MNPSFKILFATSFFFLAFVSASRDPGDFYQGCEDGTKGCFGAPPFCMETKDCTLLVSWINNGDGTYDFEIQSMVRNVADDEHYAAIGLSRNFAMGDDEALLCDNFGGEFKVTRYWNINDEDDKTSLPVGDNSGLVPGEMIEDGSFPYFYCSFKRDASVTFTPPDGEEVPQTFDLDSESFYVLTSSGPLDDDGFATKHSAAGLSDSALDLSEARREEDGGNDEEEDVNDTTESGGGENVSNGGTTTTENNNDSEINSEDSNNAGDSSNHHRRMRC